MKRFMYIASCVSLALMFVFFIIMANTFNSVFLTLGITCMTICYHFTIRLVIGGIMDRISLDNFKPNAGRFRERGFERRFYKTLRVKKWKRFVPTYNDEHFSMKNSLETLIGETCRAEAVHWLCIAASLVSIAFTAVFGSLAAFLVTGIIGALIDLVFVIIQRYNRPRLIKAAAMEVARGEDRKGAAE